MVTQNPKGANDVVTDLRRVALLIDTWALEELVDDLNSLNITVISCQFILFQNCHQSECICWLRDFHSLHSL